MRLLDQIRAPQGPNGGFPRGRRASVNAARGQHRARRLFAELLGTREASNQALYREYLCSALDYKKNRQDEIARCKALQLPIPNPLPHPGDLTIDIKTGSVVIKGPMMPEEKVVWDDDEPTVRLLVTEVLQELGYTSIEAEDGRAALEILRSDQHVNLLITDVGLPGGINGREVAQGARQARPDLKVLFITGYAESAVLSNGHLGPGMQVLAKPFPVEALASRIRSLMSTRVREPPRLASTST